jgi:hypothetical protein
MPIVGTDALFPTAATLERRVNARFPRSAQYFDPLLDGGDILPNGARLLCKRALPHPLGTCLGGESASPILNDVVAVANPERVEPFFLTAE